MSASSGERTMDVLRNSSIDCDVEPRLRLRRLSEVQPRQVRWLVPGLIPLRTLTL